MWLMPLTAIVAAGITAGMLLRYFLAERNPALLAWSAALMLLGAAAACAFAGSIDGWTELTAKTYYLVATALFTACMSLGAVYINTPRIIGHVWLAVLLLATLTAGFLLAGAEVDPVVLSGSPGPGWQAVATAGLLGDTVVSLRSIGTLILIAAAVYALVYRRAAAGQALVAAGVLSISLAGALARLDAWEWVFLGQLPGIVVVFTGAVLATRYRPEEQATSRP